MVATRSARARASDNGANGADAAPGGSGHAKRNGGAAAHDAKGDERPASSSSAAGPWALLAVCIAGIYVAFINWGLLQEQLYVPTRAPS